MGILVPKGWDSVGSGNAASDLRLKNAALGVGSAIGAVVLDASLRNIFNAEGLSPVDIPSILMFIRASFHGLGYCMNKF